MVLRKANPARCGAALGLCPALHSSARSVLTRYSKGSRSVLNSNWSFTEKTVVCILIMSPPQPGSHCQVLNAAMFLAHWWPFFALCWQNLNSDLKRQIWPFSLSARAWGSGMFNKCKRPRSWAWVLWTLCLSNLTLYRSHRTEANPSFGLPYMRYFAETSVCFLETKRDRVQRAYSSVSLLSKERVGNVKAGGPGISTLWNTVDQYCEA